MNNSRECEFAYILGQLMGMLNNVEIKNFMLEHGILPSQILTASNVLKEIAAKSFYGKND